MQNKNQAKVNIDLSHDVCVHSDRIYTTAWNDLKRLKAAIDTAMGEGATRFLLGKEQSIEFYKTLSPKEYRQEQIKALEKALEELKAKDKEEGGQ